MPWIGELPSNYNGHDEHVGYLPGQPGFDPPTTATTTTTATIANRRPDATPFIRWWPKQCTWKFCSHYIPRRPLAPAPGLLTNAAALTIGDFASDNDVSNVSNPYLIPNEHSRHCQALPQQIGIGAHTSPG